MLLLLANFGKQVIVDSGTDFKYSFFQPPLPKLSNHLPKYLYCEKLESFIDIAALA